MPAAFPTGLFQREADECFGILKIFYPWFGSKSSRKKKIDCLYDQLIEKLSFFGFSLDSLCDQKVFSLYYLFLSSFD
jgi:hypothetical protein